MAGAGKGKQVRRACCLWKEAAHEGHRCRPEPGSKLRRLSWSRSRVLPVTPLLGP